MPGNIFHAVHTLTIACLASLMWLTPALAESAPDFKLPTDGGSVSLRQYRGKAVYVDFWASWCLPCRKSFPWMNAMQQRYGNQGLAIVAINLDKDKALVEKFLDQYPADFTIAYDPSGDSAAAFRLKGMPSSYLIGPDGEIRAAHIGFREKDKAELEGRIRQLLKTLATR